MSSNEILLNLGLDIEPLKTKEEFQQALNNLKENLSNMELKFEHQLPEGTLARFIDSTEKIKSIISERFPAVDPDEFIKFVLTSPIKSNKFDFNALINLFSLLDNTSSYKNGYSDLEASITVNTANEIVDKTSYFNVVIKNIFPILIFLLTQYQNVQTTEHLNRIEHQNEILIYQNEEIDYKLELIENQNEQNTELIGKKIDQLIEQQSEYDTDQERIIEILSSLNNND